MQNLRNIKRVQLQDNAQREQLARSLYSDGYFRSEAEAREILLQLRDSGTNTDEVISPEIEKYLEESRKGLTAFGKVQEYFGQLLQRRTEIKNLRERRESLLKKIALEKWRVEQIEPEIEAAKTFYQAHNTEHVPIKILCERFIPIPGMQALLCYLREEFIPSLEQELSTLDGRLTALEEPGNLTSEE